MALFNVRVYGILINSQNEVLLSDEYERETYFTKFPGGGLELGEGTIAGLKREFMEECEMEIEIIRHLYTTDFYARSIFNDSQIISIYYLVKNIYPIQFSIKTKVFDFDIIGESSQAFRWVNLSELTDSMVSFPTEKKLIEILLSKNL
jgi:8-oxo-dGTP diphosphatase